MDERAAQSIRVKAKGHLLKHTKPQVTSNQETQECDVPTQISGKTRYLEQGIFLRRTELISATVGEPSFSLGNMQKVVMEER